MPEALRINPSAPRAAQADLAARLEQAATGLEDWLKRRDALIEIDSIGRGHAGFLRGARCMAQSRGRVVPADWFVGATQDGTPERLIIGQLRTLWPI